MARRIADDCQFPDYPKEQISPLLAALSWDIPNELCGIISAYAEHEDEREWCFLGDPNYKITIKSAEWYVVHAMLQWSHCGNNDCDLKADDSGWRDTDHILRMLKAKAHVIKITGYPDDLNEDDIREAAHNLPVLLRQMHKVGILQMVRLVQIEIHYLDQPRIVRSQF